MHNLLFAVGGTGGHLFPAQALAQELKKKVNILFGGGRLGSNLFFHKTQFPYREITSKSPFQSNPFKAVFEIGKGIKESFALFEEFSPDLILGFGSFYSFPLLAAAKLKKIPYILIESNTLPGKVNRLFSSGAQFTAIQFQETADFLKGKTAQAKMPIWIKDPDKENISSYEARLYFGLDPSLFTLLIFGGSQGAQKINQEIINLQLKDTFQVIHLCGHNQDAKSLEKHYESRNIRACVKTFEENMHLAWKAATLAICRSGAGTLSEALDFEVPTILIPWPKSADGHQLVNAQIMEKEGGAILLEERNISDLPNKIEKAKAQIDIMKEKLKLYPQKRWRSLSEIVLNELNLINSKRPKLTETF